MTRKENSTPPKETYEVGYGRPPKSGQFQPGQSGNPKGRPKPQPPPEQTIHDLMMEKRKVFIDGKPQVKTVLEVIMRQLIDSSLKKDTRATRLVLDLHKYALAKIRDDPAATEDASEHDLEILREYAERLKEEKSRG